MSALRLKCARPAALSGTWKGTCVHLTCAPPVEPDPLLDPHRIAAARRLLVEVAGPAAFDRLSALAAHRRRRPRQGHVVHRPGHRRRRLRPAPGVIGGPALLTGALSAIVVRRTASASADARAEERIADLPAVTSGQVRPISARRSSQRPGTSSGAGRLRPGAAELDRRRDRTALQLAASVVAELELSAARSAVGTSVTRLNVALEASSIGTWERDLRTGVIDWDERCAALFGLDGRPSSRPRTHGVALRAPGRRRPLHEAMQQAMEEDGQFTAEFRA